MGKKKQKGKLVTMEDRERLRLQTNLVGQETQHLATVGTGGSVVRQLHGRSIPIPPPPVPPDTMRTQSNPDPIELFDPGIPPSEPDPQLSQMAEKVTANVLDSKLTPPLPKKNQLPSYI